MEQPSRTKSDRETGQISRDRRWKFGLGLRWRHLAPGHHQAGRLRALRGPPDAARDVRDRDQQDWWRCVGS